MPHKNTFFRKSWKYFFIKTITDCLYSFLSISWFFIFFIKHFYFRPMITIHHQNPTTRWVLIGWKMSKVWIRLQVPEAKVMIDPIPTGPDGKPRLGRFGELLDENGIQILGENFVRSHRGACRTNCRIQVKFMHIPYLFFI